MSNTPTLEIVVLSKDSPHLLETLIPSLDRVSAITSAAGLNTSIVIVDTGTTNLEALQLLLDAPGSIDVDWSWVYQFSRSNNLVALGSSSDYLLFLNNDVEFSGREDQVFEHVNLMMADPEIVVLGNRLLFPDGRIQHDGVDFLRETAVFGLPFHPRAGEKPQPVETVRFALAVTGAYMMVRTESFVRVGGFDESYQRECQDVDLCLRLGQLGGKVALVDSGFVHHENATRAKGEEDWGDRSRFLRLWSSHLRALL